jgi:general secretion pathway protein A
MAMENCASPTNIYFSIHMENFRTDQHGVFFNPRWNNVVGSVRRPIPSVFVFLPLALSLSAAFASPPEQQRAEAEETARLLAKLLQSGRLVIEHNQAVIDDPHRGEKGFTPEVFERQVREEFRGRTGIDLITLPQTSANFAVPTLARELLPALIEASKEVVRDAQVVINQRGIGYKNFIPATYGSQAAARFSKRSHVQLKQTTLQPRNPKIEPDDYERSVLQWLSGRPNGEAYVSELTESGNTLRVIMPIYYQRECLSCHGEPKGEWDISGYPKEGAHDGDLAGAISVRIPLQRP